MSQIYLKNFGPIKSGFAENDGFIDIRKITVFIGNQGTGKSSIAKLISTFSWLEKELYRGGLQKNQLKSYRGVINQYFNYHSIKSYFSSETVLEYRGKAYDLTFQKQQININSRGSTLSENDNNPKYIVPKILYIPAERNLLSVVRYPEKLKGLPPSLSAFLQELDRSQQELSEPITLPISNITLEFDKLRKILSLLGNNYKLILSEASSGLQSFIPLFLVTRNIALSIQNKDISQNELSGEERTKLETEVQKVLSDDTLSDEVKSAALKVLSSKYRNERFINIVEELEQNLYPDSQKKVLYKLLEYANLTEGNQLILTTHSPYIINYLTLAIEGYKILQKILSLSNLNQIDVLKEQLEKIVPQASCISEKDVIVYELTEQGEIKQLPTYDGLPSDENYLNLLLAETNQLFSELLEIEEQL